MHALIKQKHTNKSNTFAQRNWWLQTNCISTNNERKRLLCFS